MNSKPISSYEDLCNEKERLTELLKAQKVQIQQDIELIKDEFSPMVKLSENVSKLISREDGKDPLMTAGTNFTIDMLTSTLLGKSNFLLKLVLPAILKNLSSHFIPKAPSTRKSSLYGKSMEKSTAQKTVAVNGEPKRALNDLRRQEQNTPVHAHSENGLSVGETHSTISKTEE